ncbi:MAG TPA: hypothetical protein VKQ29_01175 [Aliidongia sp.]|nr:hypothetical protein [Aliidongia sp.]
MRLVPSKKAPAAQARALLDHGLSGASELLLIAGGGIAMLLTVGIFDMLGLLS